MGAASSADPARIAHRSRLGSKYGKGCRVKSRSGSIPASAKLQTRGTGAAARLVTLLLAFGVAAWFGSEARPVVARQDAASVPIEIGAGPVREQAFALVGRTIYEDDTARVFGYLTDIIGLDPALLFTDTLPAIQTARFTYAGEIPLSSRTNRGDVTHFAGEGTVTIFYDEDAGADWDDPGSFADGEPVSEFSLLLRDTLQRQAPAIGVVVGDEQYRQETAGELVIGWRNVSVRPDWARGPVALGRRLDRQRRRAGGDRRVDRIGQRVRSRSDPRHSGGIGRVGVLSIRTKEKVDGYSPSPAPVPGHLASITARERTSVYDRAHQPAVAPDGARLAGRPDVFSGEWASGGDRPGCRRAAGR